MNRTQRNSISAVAVAVVLGLGGCSGMSQQNKNTAYGATAGGVAGAVLTGGGTLGTLGGAAVGGLLGHELTKDKDKE
jgi:osmotically inducible lipoprotein OsmB